MNARNETLEWFDENLFYDIGQDLTLDELKNLCATNRRSSILCQTEKLRALIHRKTIENEQQKELYYHNLVNDIYNKIMQKNKFSYEIFKLNRLATHFIFYSLDDHGKPYLFEFVGIKTHNYRPKESVLYTLFENRVKSFDLHGQPVRNRYGPSFALYFPTETEIKRVLNILVRGPHFDINKIVY